MTMTIESAETLRMIGELKGELGEVRGQLRELIHNSNNLRQIMEAQAPAMHRVPDIIADVASLQARMTFLEARENQRTGAMTFGGFLLKSPLLGWFFGVASMSYALWGK